MPVRYDIAAQVPQPSGALDPLNIMAQMRQQQMSEAQLARMAQSMDVQDLQARIAAQRELRQAEAAQRQAGLFGAQQQEAEQKIQAGKIDLYKNMFQNFVNDQKSLDSFVSMMERDFPQGVAAFKGKTYSDDWKQGLLKPEGDYMEAGGEVYQKTAKGLKPAPILQPEAIPGPRQDMATALIKEREGFIEKPKYDVNAYRAGYGSDTVTLPDGTVQKVTPGMRVSPEDAERDLQRRIQTEFVPKAAAKVGEENWARLPENVRASLTSIAYNYGTIPSRIVPAVQSGNPETIARAIESLAGDNKGVNAGRRMQEANIARGTGMPGSRAVPAFAAGGAPTFMGGPEIMPPINMMAPPVAPMNAMAAPQPAPVLTAPQPAQPMTVSEYVKQPLKRANTAIFKQLLNKAEDMEKANILPKLEGESAYQRGVKVLEGELPSSVQRIIDPKAEKLRSEYTNIIDQYISKLRESKSLTGGEANTVAELEAKKAILGKPNMTIDELREIIRSLDANLGTGELSSAAPETPKSRSETTRPPLSSFYAR
jgi:GH24 family phage-related lysozyme (muramidase)